MSTPGPRPDLGHWLSLFCWSYLPSPGGRRQPDEFSQSEDILRSSPLPGARWFPQCSGGSWFFQGFHHAWLFIGMLVCSHVDQQGHVSRHMASQRGATSSTMSGQIHATKDSLGGTRTTRGSGRAVSGLGYWSTVFRLAVSCIRSGSTSKRLLGSARGGQ